MFAKPNPRPNFFENEEEVTKFWKENNIFEKSIENRKDSRDYIFYDGPPFMSGMPHYGSLLSSMPKDIIPRYQTMKGKKVDRLWGWDCHGLPIENKVEKELDLHGKREIEEYGLDKFIQKCYEWNRVGIENWRWYIEKIGRWVDMDNAYRTLDQDYMESVWWTFKQMWDKGLIYKGLRTSLYSTDFATPVSDFEVSMDPDNYQDAEDIAVTVKFRLNETSEKKIQDLLGVTLPVNLLAWTTTPWTLPSNFALALSPSATYVATKNEEQVYILAKERLEEVFGDKTYEQVATIKPKDLEDLGYEQLLPFLEGHENDFRVYLSEYVTTEDGTGVLHVAPAFGEADANMGKQWDLSFTPDIDEEGNLVVGPWKGMYIRDANESISSYLEKNGALFKREVYVHRLPFYRGKNPLIYKTQEDYFINVAELKEKLIKSNEDIIWIPEHFKIGRFKYILETAPDWSISRTRSWATTMPMWQGGDGTEVVIGSRDELMELVNASNGDDKIQKVLLSLKITDTKDSKHYSNTIEEFLNSTDQVLEISATQEMLSILRSTYFGETDEESKVKPIKENEKRAYYLFNGTALDLHRPYIDRVTFVKDGTTFKRIAYTLDVWMDSGSMPFAQFHYPFVNKEKFEESFPGDFISEYTGQIRAWFYVLHVIANAIFGQPSFKNVLVSGVLAGTDGRKMSKVYNNYPDPKETIMKYGGDALRLYLLGSPLMKGNDMNFNEEDLKAQVRDVLIPLFNIYSFIVTYANIHSWNPREELAYNQRKVTKDEYPWDHMPFNDVENQLDAWVLTKLELTIKQVDKSLEAYDIPLAIRTIKELISDISKWYIRRSRSRFAKGEDMVLSVLYYTFTETLKLLAPVAPFITEYIYKNLVTGHLDTAPDSIHLCDYPKSDERFISEYSKIISEMSVVQKIAELGNTIRANKQIKVRQPLLSLELVNLNPDVPALADWMIEIIKDELNVKEVAEVANLSITDESVILEDSTMKVKVALDVKISSELKSEGVVREISRKIQATRKKMGLQMGEIIQIRYTASDRDLGQIVESNSGKIMKNVSAEKIINDEIIINNPNAQKLNIEGQELVILIAKVDTKEDF